VISAGVDDLDLKKVLTVSLINLGKFDEAYSSSQNLSGLEFERAYSLYKLSQFDQCLRETQSKPEKNFRLLRAQTVTNTQLFKLSRTQEAINEYEELIKQDPETSDLKVNLSSTLTIPGSFEQSLNHSLLTSTNDWELLFNKSCALAELRRYSEALNSLRAAERIVTQDQDLQEELWLIKGQLGYIFQCMQEKTKAIDIYEEILKSKADGNIKAVAKNNLVVCKGLDSNQGLKILHESLSEDNKLVSLQRLGILQNIGILSYKKRKINESQESIRACEEIDPDNERLGFFKTFVLFKEKKHEEYKNFLISKDKPWAYALLMKLLLEQNKLKDAEDVFESMTRAKKQALDVQDYSEISALLEKAGMMNKALETLQLACKDSKDRSLVIRLGNLLRKTNQSEKAIQVFEDFLSTSQDPLIIANLVLSSAESRPDLARKWSSKLSQVNIKSLYNSANAIESLDEIIDKLEFSNLQGRPKAEEKVLTDLKKKKRKRKPKYPKGFDPSNPNNKKPDPERWLPKEERKEFKKKGKKKQVKMKGPQGIVSAEAQGQEIGGFSKGPSTAHTQAAGEGKKNKKRKK
jgi:signal recognition particle subunit SRP72